MKISLTKGHFALIDAADASRILCLSWQATYNLRAKRWYATAKVRRGGKRYTVSMHRYVLDAPQGIQVDHVNGDGLDNRRGNLRLATRAQNQHNRRTQHNNATGYKGVTYSKKDRSYWVQFQANGRRTRLGGFKTAPDAARTYDSLARRYHGAFARLNFPDGLEQKA